jgi:hypothetical protein
MVHVRLYFFPSQITVSSLSVALTDIIDAQRVVPAANRNLGRGVIPFIDTLYYPRSWADNDADLANFQAVAKAKLFCPPILSKLIVDPRSRSVWSTLPRLSRELFSAANASCRRTSIELHCQRL